jgi:hypothetical protein
MTVCGSDRQSESGGIWIDPRWKTISRVDWAEKVDWARYCYGDQTYYQNIMGWEREILGSEENCEEEFGPLQSK